MLGRSGIVSAKHEGDGGTPAGVFPLRRVYYRPDRLVRPGTALRAQALSPNDGWCDASGDPNYNKPVVLPYAASAEALWRQDGAYDVFAVIGYNDAPIVPGAGSAIFLHVIRQDGAVRLPTAGCVALEREHLLELLSHIRRQTQIRIG
nr:L,D-transpeptidase family protein [Rhizomicrobium palustre]